MGLNLKDILDLIIRNIDSKGNPIGIDPANCVSWARDLDLRKGGETIIYTSCMYQMIPYITRLTNSIERFEKAGGIALKLGKAFSSIMDLGSVLRVPEDELKRFQNIVRGIVSILNRIGVDVGYLYDEEPYSGSLLYELGVLDVFASLAENTVSVFRKYGVRKVIAIDPHTYFTLSKIYPKYVDMGGIEVIHYLEIIDRKKDSLDLKKIDKDYTIHDPCLLARYMKIIDPQRNIIGKMGIDLKEPERSGIRTRCCGGPLEAISPKISRTIGSIRVSELAKHSNRAIVMCPICFSNLSRSVENNEIEIYDIAEILLQGVGNDSRL